MGCRILFTGVGRRIELLQAFRDAAVCLGVPLKILGADMSSDAPALAYCDETRLVCGMREEGYIPQLLSICKADGVGLLIPTIDTDLRVLAEHKTQFERIGTQVMVSAPEMVAKCRDKNVTARFFRECGLLAPETVNDIDLYDAPYPCFVKPKDGSSSIGAHRANDASELKAYASELNDYVVQPFVEGDEYTVDIFCDFDGAPISVVPRRRLAVRAGEVLKTRVCMDTRIIEECERLISVFRPCGPMTVQLIRDAATGDDYFIEINPRFGGGAPLSMKAGADSAEAILRLISGEKVGRQLEGIADNAVYSRFDQSVCPDCGTGLPVRGVVFDLDDTLYLERDYVRSGFEAVREALPGVERVAERLWSFFEQGEPAIDRLLEEEGMLDCKARALAAYREHAPKIAMPSESRRVIQELKERGIKVGIITDGRSEGQRAKLSALGLWDLVDNVIITDELGGLQFRKPCDIAFRIMQRRWGVPFGQMAYVGDNVLKDFQAPKQLGMKSMWLRNGDGLYADTAGGACVQVDYEIATLGEVLGLV